MLTMSDEVAAALTRSWVQTVRVESWLGDTLLADDVPIAGGTEDVDRTLSVPERVALSIPREDRGVSWRATAPTDPLAPFGQRLRVSVGVTMPNGVTEYLQRGWYVITSAETENDTVRVEAAGMLRLLDEARFLTPYQPKAGSTFSSVVQALCGSALPVDVSSSLTDRAVPSTLAWDEDRLGALFEVLDAWPAEGHVTEAGYLAVDPVGNGASVLTLTDGADGTVVSWGSGVSREGSASVAVARGQASDGAQVQGIAYDTVSTSPTYYGGPFNPLPVPVFFFSPLLTTVAQCRAAAQTVLARTKRKAAGQKLAVQIVPHPGLQAGDVVTVTGGGLTAALCVIDGLSLPLVPGGPMTLTLGVI